MANRKLRPLGEELLYLPNLITLLRIGMIPLVLVTIDNYSPRMSALSCILFGIAALSDALDGYLARRLQLITVIGKFLDPLADKLIVLSVLVMLVDRGRAPTWLVIILMTRELAVTGLRAIASQQGLVIAAGNAGKTKTALQLVGISFLLVHFRYHILVFDFDLDFHIVGIYLLYLSLAVSILSAVEYFQFFARAAVAQSAEMERRGLKRARHRESLRRRRSRLGPLRRRWLRRRSKRNT